MANARGVIFFPMGLGQIRQSPANCVYGQAGGVNASTAKHSGFYRRKLTGLPLIKPAWNQFITL